MANAKAVAHLEEVLEVSERPACEVTVQPRSAQRDRVRKRGKDAALAAVSTIVKLTQVRLLRSDPPRREEWRV